MTRRDVLRVVSRVAATAAGQSFFSSWLLAAHEHSSAPPEDVARWTNYKPQFFTPAQFSALDQFTAVLIPTDETPGAREAHVAPFIDFVVNAAAEYAPEMQSQWRSAVTWLTEQPFADRPAAEQHTWMESVSQPSSAGFKYFRLMKDLSVYAFYTSRVGMIDNLEYKGLAYLTAFPGCSHPEHQAL